MSEPRYFDKQGQPLELHTWARLFEDWDYKQVARPVLPNGYRVSTVWLGVNQRFEPGPPLIFETMVFGHPAAEPCERYSTEAEARAGHDRLVAIWAARP